MPHYFFHLRDGDQVHVDREGMDLPNLHAALMEVTRAIQELRRDPAGGHALAFMVADSSGRTLLMVPVPQERQVRPFLAPQHVERGNPSEVERLLH